MFHIDKVEDARLLMSLLGRKSLTLQCALLSTSMNLQSSDLASMLLLASNEHLMSFRCCLKLLKVLIIKYT